MKLSDIQLHEEILRFYTNSGITELYPPQAKAVKAGLLENKNLVISIPTASGKTLLAEFAMLKSILEDDGKALYIVPLRALASEKYERFCKFKSIKKGDGKVVSTAISTGDFDSRDEWLGKYDIIVATFEKVDSLLRNRTHWMDEITIVVADEIHLINSPERGPTLEIVLAKLMHKRNPKIIALSATIGNAKEIAEWLKAELVISQWRPIELKEGILLGKTINFVNGKREVSNKYKDSAIALVMDTLMEGGQCLVFENSRRNAEDLTSRISMYVNENKQELHALASSIKDTSEVETANKLAVCVEKGCAFHHAGLTLEQRRIIEEGFRNGIIRVIVATPTLAAGLNLPARRVIIKGYRRYDVNYGMIPIPVLEYKQMAGRAGRPGLDPYGEAILIAKNNKELEQLMQGYVLAHAEDIESKLGTENALRTHVLSAIASNVARNMEELLEFMRNTFYSYQQETQRLKKVIEKVVDFLINKKMIIDKQGLQATTLGKIVSRLYIDPLSASIIIQGMQSMEEKGIYYDLTLLHLACCTPDTRPLYLRSKDYEWLKDFVMEHAHEFVYIPENIHYEFFLSWVKTACVMLDWINEEKEEDIVEKYGIGEGDIRTLTETTRWLMHSMAELATSQNKTVALKAKELVKRLEYGANSELLELIKIKGIGRVRARRLYHAGFRDIEALRTSNPNAIAKIIGTRTTQKILKQIGIEIKECMLRDS